MKKYTHSVLATFIALVVIMSGIFIYANGVRKAMRNTIAVNLQDDTFEKAKLIYTFNRDAQSSIKLISSFLTSQMTSEIIQNPNELLSKYKSVAPLKIQYVTKDGMNMLNSVSVPKKVEPIDVRDRNYFVNGMAEKTGTWINFNPIGTNQVIVTFYTPLYFNDKVAGVVCGDVYGRDIIENELLMPVSNHNLCFVLCDNDFRVVASSDGDIPAGIDFTKYADEEFVQDIEHHIKNEDKSTFSYFEDKKEGLACVVPIPANNLKLVGMVQPRVLHSSVLYSSLNNYYLVAFIVFVLIIYFAVRFYFHDKFVKKVEREKYMQALIDSQATQISLLTSFSDIYYSAYLLDLKNDSFVEIKSEPNLRKNIDKSLSLKSIFEENIKTAIVPEFAEKVLAFTNLKTIPNRLKDKKIISIECLSKHLGWLRVSFITVEVDSEQLPVKVLYVAQVIDDEKRREQTLMDSAFTDELTGLYNRRSYENDLAKLKRSDSLDNLVYITFDVNGLKVVNDNLGHEAGDELICGAADCLAKTFRQYGKVYRTGGDEFEAIIYCNSTVLENLKKSLEEEVNSWSGKLVSELKISAGYVICADEADLTVKEIEKLADQRMYKNKSEFYAAKGIDRRGQQTAFELLYQTYTKILKINLLKNEYTVLQMSKNEMVETQGSSIKFSEAIEKFLSKDLVLPEDKKKIAEKTSISFMRDYFLAKNSILSFQYRKKINDEFCPMVMEIIPYKDFSEDNQIVYLYAKNIEVS